MKSFPFFKEKSSKKLSVTLIYIFCFTNSTIEIISYTVSLNSSHFEIILRNSHRLAARVTHPGFQRSPILLLSSRIHRAASITHSYPLHNHIDNDILIRSHLENATSCLGLKEDAKLWRLQEKPCTHSNGYSIFGTRYFEESVCKRYYIHLQSKEDTD